jgi:hypothetical protein
VIFGPGFETSKKSQEKKDKDEEKRREDAEREHELKASLMRETERPVSIAASRYFNRIVSQQFYRTTSNGKKLGDFKVSKFWQMLSTGVRCF